MSLVAWSGSKISKWEGVLVVWNISLFDVWFDALWFVSLSESVLLSFILPGFDESGFFFDFLNLNYLLLFVVVVVVVFITNDGGL
jgi:hypothetical protein